MSSIRIVSYGTGHHDKPAAYSPVVIDTTTLHNPPDDPAVRATLTQLTGLHPDVAAYVLATPGADKLIATALRRIEHRIATGYRVIHVHVHCYGGRHRSVAIAEHLAADLRLTEDDVRITHRHIARPILRSRLHNLTGH
ncbi:RNase adapter RapZ [Streptomyces sp. NPDC048659]|uniref:RapZ C-terminal domain-containing protein n=1 Tax=Streptomyces sp. NPDC048659 TaxID=3155489 RepID=UPI00342189D5